MMDSWLLLHGENPIYEGLITLKKILHDSFCHPGTPRELLTWHG